MRVLGGDVYRRQQARLLTWFVQTLSLIIQCTLLLITTMIIAHIRRVVTWQWLKSQFPFVIKPLLYSLHILLCNFSLYRPIHTYKAETMLFHVDQDSMVTWGRWRHMPWAACYRGFKLWRWEHVCKSEKP